MHVFNVTIISIANFVVCVLMQLSRCTGFLAPTLIYNHDHSSTPFD